MAKTSDAPVSEAQLAHDAVSTGRILAEQGKVRIKLMQTPAGELDLPDEVVIVNGYRYQIQRGVAVEVPETVADILEQAGRI